MNAIQSKIQNPQSKMLLEMGPQHPATHGVLRLTVELDGETILGVTPHVGYLHRCAEKLGERDLYAQALPHTDRLDYLAAHYQNLAFCEAIESLLGLEAPPRARLLRVLIGELQRLASHLVWLGSRAFALGATTPGLYCFRDRDEILDLFEEMSGARLTYSYIRIGGFHTPPPERFFEWARALLARLPGRIDQYESLLTDNPIFRARTVGIGRITGADAIAWGLTGPALRASGVDRDLRRDAPYAAYDWLPPRVITATEGDVYARYLVRVGEMRESIRLARLALDELTAGPEGPWCADDPLVVPPPKEDVLTDMAAMIRHWVIAVHGYKVPAGEIYRAVESPRGEFGVFAVSDGSARPHRLHYRSPCFVSIGAIEKLARGHLFADLVAIIGSLDILLGEVDR